jgi:hypothetical protein
MSNQERLLRRGQLADARARRHHLAILIDADVFAVRGYVDTLAIANHYEKLKVDEANECMGRLLHNVHEYRDVVKLMNKLQEALGEPIGDDE